MFTLRWLLIALMGWVLGMEEKCNVWLKKRKWWCPSNRSIPK